MSGLGLPGDLYGTIMPTQVKVNNTTPIYVPTGAPSATLTVSSLTVSSINGASPSGGGGVVSTLQSLTITESPGIALNWNAGNNGNYQMNYDTSELSSFALGLKYASTPVGLIPSMIDTNGAFAHLGVSSVNLYAGSSGTGVFPDATLDSKGLTISSIRQPLIQSGFGLLGNDGFSTFTLPVNYANTNYTIMASYDGISTMNPQKPLGTYIGNSGGKSVSSFALQGDIAFPIQWTTFGNI